MAKDKNEKASQVGRQSPWTTKEWKAEGACFADVPSFGPLVDMVLNSGDGLILARTRDGGAICVQLLTGDLRHKIYAAHQDDLDQIFRDLHSAYKDGQMSM